MYEASPSRTASFDSFHEVEGKLGIEKLSDVVNLEFSLGVWSKLNGQGNFVNKRHANRRVRVIGDLEGISGKKMES